METTRKSCTRGRRRGRTRSWLCVVVPSVAGLAVRSRWSESQLRSAQPHLKLINALILLALNYSNAAVSLPEAIGNPEPGFLLAILVAVVSLCVLAFAVGGWIAGLLHADRSQRISLMYGLGMSNNGTGLGLASLALAAHPRVLLPIICYNLVQHLIAGAVALRLERGTTEPAPQAA